MDQQYMVGPDFERPAPEAIETLYRASTASITTVMRRLYGIRNIWMPLKPLVPGMKMVGPALTLRSVPGRDDLQPLAYQPGTRFPGHPDGAIDAIRPGDVLVHDGCGLTSEGLFGDLLTMRVKVNGAAGLVSDMAVRDAPHLKEQHIPIFSRGSGSNGGSVFNVDVNVPIGCAGVLVCPGDIVAGDDDGVVVIPRGMLDEIVEEVELKEDREEFIRMRLAEGAPLRGLYPTSKETEAQFLQWRAAVKKIETKKPPISEEEILRYGPMRQKKQTDS